MTPNKTLKAVVDIGSNNIRLVIYGELGRAPVIIYSDKSVCQLGKNLEQTGVLNPTGVTKGLKILNRFVSVTKTMNIDDIRVFATAAVREASNGADFLSDIKSTCGIDTDVLSGEVEAKMAGQGVWYGIPDADGIVADLGGGSLELAEIKDGQIGRVCSMPIGVLRYGDAPDIGAIAKQVSDILSNQSFLGDNQYNNLYLVGGAWRALMHQHMVDTSYELNLLHHYTQPSSRITKMLTPLITGTRKLSKLSAISKRRLPYIPVASLVLQELIDQTQATDIVTSAYGAREGILVDSFTDEEREQSALLTSARTINTISDVLCLSGDVLYHWVLPMMQGVNNRQLELLRASCHMVNSVRFDDPDHRGEQMLSWLMQRPLLGVDHYERAFMGYVTNSRYQKVSKITQMGKLVRNTLDGDDRRMAKMMGASMALAYALSGGVRDILEKFTLEISDDTLILWGLQTNEHMVRGSVIRALERAGKFLPDIDDVQVILK